MGNIHSNNSTRISHRDIGNSDFLTKITVPRKKPPRSGGRMNLTIYDTEVFEIMEKWAADHGTNMSSIMSHLLDLGYGILAAADEPQTSIRNYIDMAHVGRMKSPRLDDPMAIWLDYLAETCKTPEDYETHVEAHMRRIRSACNDRYQELMKRRGGR